MPSAITDVVLLDRLREGGAESAWNEFDARYAELITGAARRCGLQPADVEEVRQMVMFGLCRSLPRFRYDPSRGRFRSYLTRAVFHAVARLRRRLKRTVSLDEVACEPSGESRGPAVGADSAADYQQAVRRLRPLVGDRNMEVFEGLLSGESVSQVAERMGMSSAAVHKVKQRLRGRLRARLEGRDA